MPIKIETLNIGRGLKHLEKTREHIRRSDADVFCLQDVQRKHIPLLTEGFKGGMKFAAMTNHWVAPGVREHVGIGIFARRLEFFSVSTHAYVGRVSPVLDLEGIDVVADGTSVNHQLELVRATESRLLLVAEVVVEGRELLISTTHGPWVKDGNPDDHQFAAVGRLSRIVQLVMQRNHMVLVGDFNFSRDSKTQAVYHQFVERSGVEDCMPESITSTLDTNHHPLKGKVGVVSDSFFSDGHMKVSDISVTFDVSDHGAVKGTVSF